MDRKEFLKACTGGLCACAGACLPAAAHTAEPEDWRWGFLKRRYAKLLSLLGETMDKAALERTLVELGSFCSAEYDKMLQGYRGNPQGFADHIRKTSSGDVVTFAQNLITVTSPDRSDCFCPLNGVAAKTPGVVCNCSLGWQQHSWETVLGKKVRVDLIESVLQGGTRCVFEIHVLEA